LVASVTMPYIVVNVTVFVLLVRMCVIKIIDGDQPDFDQDT